MRTVTDEDHAKCIRAVEKLGQAMQTMADVMLESAQQLSELYDMLTLTPETGAGKITETETI